MPRRGVQLGYGMEAIPESADTEYVRGKLEERTSDKLHQHSQGRFDESGYVRWADRSGREYIDEQSPDIGPQADYSSPVVGNGFSNSSAGRANVGGSAPLSRLVGRGTKKGQMRETARRAYTGSASPDYSMLSLLRSHLAGGCHSSESSCEGNGRPRRQRPSKATGSRSARGQLVSQLMRERGVSLGEASRIIKSEGLM